MMGKTKTNFFSTTDIKKECENTYEPRINYKNLKCEIKDMD